MSLHHHCHLHLHSLSPVPGGQAGHQGHGFLQLHFSHPLLCLAVHAAVVIPPVSLGSPQSGSKLLSLGSTNVCPEPLHFLHLPGSPCSCRHSPCKPRLPTMWVLIAELGVDERVSGTSFTSQISPAVHVTVVVLLAPFCATPSFHQPLCPILT